MPVSEDMPGDLEAGGMPAAEDMPKATGDMPETEAMPEAEEMPESEEMPVSEEMRRKVDSHTTNGILKQPSRSSPRVCGFSRRHGFVDRGLFFCFSTFFVHELRHV